MTASYTHKGLCNVDKVVILGVDLLVSRIGKNVQLLLQHAFVRKGLVQ